MKTQTYQKAAMQKLRKVRPNMKKLTLIQRFTLVSLVALAVFGVVLGWIVTTSLESNMLTRSKQLTASIVSDQVLNEFVADDLATPKTGSDYEDFLPKIEHLALGPNVERVKIWNRDGTVIWSNEKQLVGQTFPDNDELNESLSGETVSEISKLDETEHSFERSFGRLLALYIPIRFEPQGEIETVFEVYQNLDPLYADISQQKRIVWSSITLGFATLFAVLFTIVWHASRRIQSQSEEIAQSEVRHRSLIQSAPNGIISIDHNGRIILFNASAERMFGYSAQEVMGQPLEMLMPENYRAKHRAAMTRFYETGESTTHGKAIELEGLRREGQVFPVELSLSLSEEGEYCVTGIIIDISERKATQEMEQQLHLAGRLATVGEMAAGVAHELNNPLTAVQGMAQLLNSRNDLDESLMSDLETIYNEAQRASKITSNLLSFARRHEPEKRVVFINEVLEKSIELHAYRMRVNNIEITTELAPDLPLTMADFHQIQQVFANLITNAEQAMTEAHGRGKLHVKTEKMGETIEITFADDGPGIPQENMKNIFNSFFTTKESGKGTGLGLSICRSIIENHGGRMYARSEPGEGATFVVEMPIVSEEQAAVEETDLALGQTIIQDGIG